MASVLQNVFVRALFKMRDNEGVKKLKSLASHSSLYLGIVIYTAIGAKVSQLYSDKNKDYFKGISNAGIAL